MNTFIIRKMAVSHQSTIQYHLNTICLNDFLDKKISLAFTGNIFCIQCNRKIKKSFQQGYCFPCMQKINECNNCMIHPEKCLVETGKCNATDWVHEHCHQTHLVYLANSSGLKVGITRTKNNPSRWIDQGAAQALPIFQTHNRYQAGIVEVAFKSFVADKTNWRVMLRENVVPIDLITLKKELLLQAEKTLEPILKKYLDEIIPISEDKIFTFNYPVLEYAAKINSLSFDKMPIVEGVLKGIKGQYLLLDGGVLNIRKFGGYEVALL
ncbi:MAG: DUF2797 domain-containing protein [Coxiellaceae bacterium]|nr:DUF2797 domain-containing protein [Coxiellaceae bacterium]